MDEVVSDFLKSVDLEHLYEKFEYHAIRMVDLVDMTNQDLIEIGVDKLGYRKRILNGLKNLNKVTKENSSDDAADHGHFRQNPERILSESDNDKLPENLQPLLNEGSNVGDVSMVHDVHQIPAQNSNRLSHTTASAEVTEVLQKVTQFKIKARDMISRTYRNISTMLHGDVLAHDLKKQLKQEWGDIDKIIAQSTTDLEEFTCPIVVAGETSSGKSSFVNLLLGVDLLQQSPLPCTSPICKIRNKREKSISCTDQHDRVHPVVIKSDVTVDEVRKILADRVCLQHETLRKEDQTRESVNKSEYKFIDICWPIPRLDESIVIVDTPGVASGNDILTERLYEYLPQAIAFIYVLNTPNAGGVQSDRIMKIQNELERHKKETNQQLFHPERALFICNKWDQMHQHPEKVYTHVKRTLHKHWTGFTDDKLFKLSAHEEMNNSKAGRQITKQFSDILKGIENMIPASTEEKARRHLWWQEKFIFSCVTKLQVIINGTRTSEEEGIKQIEMLTKKVDEIDRSLGTKRKAVSSDVKTHCVNVVRNINCHLHQKETCDKMFSWTDDDLPNDGSMDEITAKIDKLVGNAIQNELKNSIQGIERQNLEKFIYESFNRECCKILEEFESMDSIIYGGAYEFIKKEEQMQIRKGEIGQTEFYDNLSMGEKIGLALSSPILIPLGIVLGFISAVVLIPFGIGSVIKNKINKNNYKSGKAKFAKERGSMVLEQISIDVMQENILPVLHKCCDEVLHHYFDVILPNRLLAIRTSIHQLRTGLNGPRAERKLCHSLEKEIQHIHDIIVASNIALLQDGNILVDNITMNFDGSFGNIAEITKDNGVHKSSVTTLAYKPTENNETQYNGLAEIYRLRKLPHDNLATIYGICPFKEKDSVGYQIFVKFCRRNLDIEVITDGIPWSMSKEYIKDAIEGLSHLHTHCMIHKDIRLSTILIDGGHAKLSFEKFGSQSIPKGKIEDVPTIISPEAIKSSGSFEADTFQIGIVIWEALYGKRAYFDGDKPIKETYEELYFAIILGERPPIDPSKIQFNGLIEECWNDDPDERPSLINIKQRLQQ